MQDHGMQNAGQERNNNAMDNAKICKYANQKFSKLELELEQRDLHDVCRI